jgi:4-hydroxybenzoate polyprenyltransferase
LKNSLIPLVVDLDETLIKSDMLLESANQFVLRHPFNFAKLFYFLFKGKVALKEKLTEGFSFDPSTLPYNKKVLDIVAQEKGRGRLIILATASHINIANTIACYLKLFDLVIATSTKNTKGLMKLKALRDKGITHFDYIGDSYSDIPLFEKAGISFLANKNIFIVNRLLKKNKSFSILDNKNFFGYLYALRPHQWLKNLLLFIPIISSRNLDNFSMVKDVFTGFILFSLIASSVYLINDLADINHDRAHKEKKRRPLASGAMNILHGWLLSIFLFLLAVLLAFFFLPKSFIFCLIVYFSMTLAYSFFLKNILAADVLILSTLYTIRVIAGSLAIDIAVSYWILAFCIFIFTSLALVKRCSEIINLNSNKKLTGRAYSREDLIPLMSTGLSSGLISVLVLALYLNDQSSLIGYSNQRILWLSCPLLMFWVLRLWLLAFRGSVNEDPVLFAIKDRMSFYLIALVTLFIFLAW